MVEVTGAFRQKRPRERHHLKRPCLGDDALDDCEVCGPDDLDVCPEVGSQAHLKVPERATGPRGLKGKLRADPDQHLPEVGQL